jgi:hypothetical protein
MLAALLAMQRFSVDYFVAGCLHAMRGNAAYNTHAHRTSGFWQRLTKIIASLRLSVSEKELQQKDRKVCMLFAVCIVLSLLEPYGRVLASWRLSDRWQFKP